MPRTEKSVLNKRSPGYDPLQDSVVLEEIRKRSETDILGLAGGITLYLSALSSASERKVKKIDHLIEEAVFGPRKARQFKGQILKAIRKMAQ